jgi:hypothetical protein
VIKNLYGQKNPFILASIQSDFKNITIDAGYGTMKYLTDQLPGSNMDYWYSRRWVDASSGQKGMQWMMIETR